MSTLKEIFESINPKISRADAARLMKEDGILKVIAGVTTLLEVYRVEGE